MPPKPLKPCRSNRCPNLTQERYCEAHIHLEKEAEQRRGTAHSRGYNHKWNKARLRFLKQHPLCIQCNHDGKIVAASVVDHIVPHKGDQVKFWDVTNWQPLCETHHNIKTVKYDGGFGR